MIAALPLNEEERLRVLQSLELLDTAPEPVFDAFTLAAQQIAGTEIALVSLIDAERQWFKSNIGVDMAETPRDFAFCAHAILGKDPLCVEDATLDLRFSDNPFVTDAPYIRAYAGAPIAVDGFNVGTLCALSATPRRWTPEVRAALTALATAAAQHLDARRRLAFKNRLLQTTNDGVLAASGDGLITYWNAAAERMLGWTALEAVGQSVDIIVPEPFRARHHNGFERVRQTGKDGFGGRPVPLNALHRDGSEVPIELTLATWRGGDGVTVAGIFRDCSERAALAEARAANLAKDRFLANMSHEIRTPLNGLLGLAEVLARTEISPAQAEILDVMRDAGETLEKLVADVLDCASLDAGRLQLSAEPFDLSALLERVVLNHRPAADAKGLGLAWSGPDSPVLLNACGARLEQILDKLIGNAVKFTPGGAVRLLVRRPAQDLWRFEITDTGPGFSPAMADRMFTPFNQSDDSATRVHGGSGLGLTLSRQLAREMGGELEAENRPEGGARLILTLPMPAHAGAVCPEPARAA